MQDILFENNDSVKEIGESTLHHQKDILMFDFGWNKFAPHIAVGVANYLDDETTVEDLKSAITTAYKRDGMVMNDIEITSTGKIRTNANY